MNQALRIQTSFINGIEKRALVWLAKRMPRWVNSDMLTAVGTLGALIVAIGFALSCLNVQWLWLSSFGLLVNWFGDSLDGTLARVRDCQRHIDQHQGKKQPIVQSAPLPIQRGIDQKTSHEEQRGHIHYDTSGCSSRHSFYLLLPEYRYRDCRYRVPCTVIYARIHYLVCGGMCQGNTASVMIGLDLLTKIW